MGDMIDLSRINLEKFLLTKPTENNPYFLKRNNSRTHYILWWDELGEFCYVHKSKNKKAIIDIASIIIDTDVDSYISWYLKKEYFLYENIKLHFSGTILKDDKN